MGTNSGTEKHFEIVEHNGKLVRKYPDGTFRGEHGEYAGQTRERAQELAERRHQIAKGAIVRGIKKATGQGKFYDAIQMLAEKRAEVALTDMGRAGNDAFRQLLIMVDAYRPNQQVEVKRIVQNNTAHFELSPGLQKRIQEFSAAVSDAIEGDYDDAE